MTGATYRIGVDVGGTFTDLVAVTENGDVLTAKVPSTQRDQSEGVMACVQAAGIEADEIGIVAHGTTVATNALLERRGARTALVTTEGFRDLIEIGRQNRPSLYDLTRDRPPALVPRALRFTVSERMGPDGEVAPLDEETLAEAVSRVSESEVEAVAVCLLFGFLHPEHERRVGAALRRALPDLHVSLSSEVLPEFREYERLSTTVADAYLGPKLAAYLRRLTEKLEGLGAPPPLVMQSSGGVIDVGAATERAAACVLSGPAGGVVGGAFVASRCGLNDVLTFDMGGTSTDVAPVVGGRVQTTTEADVAGVPIRFPMVDVHTVSAGGGSIAWVDEGGVLRVGPHSAGADPGPAAYDRGGRDVTVTDANLLLGYLADGVRLGGEVVLRRKLAQEAMEDLADSLGMGVEETAAGVVAVAEAEMVRALRFVSVERGLDPRDLALAAFGGAGPMHACALAEELRIRRVLVPRAGGVLSALGLAISDLRRDYVEPFPRALDSTEATELEQAFARMEETARGDLDSPSTLRAIDLRYRGQSFELTIDASELDGLEVSFHDAHERRYGYSMEKEPVEVVGLRLVATTSSGRVELSEAAASGDPAVGTRAAYFDGGWSEVAVMDRTRMGWGSEVEGPCIVEFPESTCVVRSGWRGAVDETGTLSLEAE